MGVQNGVISEGVRGGLSSFFSEVWAPTEIDEEAISFFLLLIAVSEQNYCFHR